MRMQLRKEARLRKKSYRVGQNHCLALARAAFSKWYGMMRERAMEQRASKYKCFKALKGFCQLNLRHRIAFTTKQEQRL